MFMDGDRRFFGKKLLDSVDSFSKRKSADVYSFDFSSVHTVDRDLATRVRISFN